MGGLIKNHKFLLLLVMCFLGVGFSLIPVSPLKAEEPKDKPEEGKKSPVCDGNPPTGKVKCNYEGGDNYEGSFVNGKPEGQGIYVYANGDRYEGEFRNGLPHGKGMFLFKDDARYIGQFQEGSMKYGTVIFVNGDRYIGNFEIVRNVQTNVVSSQPNGQGEFIYASGDYYKGEFFAGVPFGRGILTRTDGTICQGYFLNTKLDAKDAKCTYKNGLRYEGELREGLPHGLGTLIDTKGTRFPGDFRKGKLVE